MTMEDPYAGGPLTDILLYQESTEPLARAHDRLVQVQAQDALAGQYDPRRALGQWQSFVDEVSRSYRREMRDVSYSSRGRHERGHAFTRSEREEAAEYYWRETQQTLFQRGLHALMRAAQGYKE
jgi:hypothetical protein